MMDHKKYWTYIVSSRSGTLYIGMCNNIERRMAEHKSGKYEGFASKYHCNRLVYFESFDDVRSAIDREKQLKGWRREKKVALIESRNQRWADLAEKWGAEMVFANQRMSDKSNLVILSGTGSSPSELPAESKDPILVER
jgi:putative endonuclease